jgi:hypothetical protein
MGDEHVDLSPQGFGCDESQDAVVSCFTNTIFGVKPGDSGALWVVEGLLVAFSSFSFVSISY